ncbi:MAG: taurine dioxygenase [Rhodospirillales bacterium 70-18]|nr:TauD/TfdA family dioxygenase [Rhodospirillales bacterium]OJY76194.1 MAG: taurine dioxygenase [Rhodospirillales bacterium 70-18]
MFTVRPNDAILGATIEGFDAARPMTDAVFGHLLAALGRHGVLRFPDQELDARQLKDFSERFGDIQAGIGERRRADVPEVGVLSNVKEGGEYIGLPDAGQDWHTDMSYRDVVGFVNVLYGVKVPVRNGRALGGTEFANMHAAYEGLPEEIRSRLANATATHDFDKFWSMMVARPGSTRKPMTPEQRAKRPPAIHPLFLTHPLTGRKVLYANPGYTMRINELPPDESARMLDILFAHQLQPQYRYLHTWRVKDLLVWDHIGTIHQAIADYLPHEERLMLRCQVMATRLFTPEFLRPMHAVAA